MSTEPMTRAFDHSHEKRRVWVAGLGPCVCEHCAKLGDVDAASPEPPSDYVDCPKCDGWAEHVNSGDGSQCPLCDGTGEVRSIVAECWAALWKARERLEVRARQVANYRRAIKQLQRVYESRDLTAQRFWIELREVRAQRDALWKERDELKAQLRAALSTTEKQDS
jgi:hypothetical protein